ncbi:MAG TPA: hypothetical protein PK029_00990 [Bacteroidales bacterium]|nr:MAG: hypothetical protein BWY22_01073 [Bacteroidetes bacterium ADurb.Bin217]HPH15716.1 hypothetical protein [Bacteroidales bacterium]HPM12454.1 hypothetical protein [Bacteroidales bacterium]
MIEQECSIPPDFTKSYVTRMLQKRLRMVHIGFGLVAFIFIFIAAVSKSFTFFVIGALILGFVYLYMRASFTYEFQKIAQGLRIVISNNSIRKYIDTESLEAMNKQKRSQAAYNYNQVIPFTDITSVTIKSNEIIVFTKQANTTNEFGRITIPCEIESFENISDFFISNPELFPRISRVN